MKARLLLLLILFLIHTNLFPQSTNNVWVFGWKCGVDFNTTPPTGIATAADGYEGCASLSDSSGQLLMYTTGDTVFNRLFHAMPNGGNILGTSATISSCTQGSLIVPKPDSDHEYYVFALQGITDALPLGKLFYSLVDMDLDGGLGDVVSTEKLIQLDMQLGEKMTAIPGTCDNIWVIVVPKSNDEFRAYEVTSCGVNHTPVVSPITPVTPYTFDIGVLKGAHDGSRLVAAVYGGAKFQVYDFDKNTGMVSNPINFPTRPIDAPYTACFSPDDSKLYTLCDSVYQYDLSLPTTSAIIGSKTGLASISIDSISLIGDMKTAIDGKLYLAKVNGSSLACFNNPNAAGVAAGFVPTAITLPTGSMVGLGLPNAVVNSVMTGKPTINVQDTFMCEPWIASSSAMCGPYTWSTGDTTKNITIAQPGKYWVFSALGCGKIDSFFVGEAPPINYLDDMQVCYGDSVVVTLEVTASSSASVLWSTGSTNRDVTVRDTGTYWVEVTDGGCVNVDTMSLRFKGCGCEFLFPDAFSPNGDGLNDYFLPAFIPERCNGLETYAMQIFNRWGEMVYSGSHMNKGWDGSFRGQKADIGVYMFMVQYRDRFGENYSRKGDLTLIR